MSISTSAAGRPTGRPRSGAPTHVQRPGSGTGYLLASEALANPPPEVRAVRSAGSARRRRHAQRRAALRRAGASHPASPGDAPAGAHLGAARARRAAQRLRHRIADRRSGGAGRRGSRGLPPVDPVRAARAAAGRAGGRARRLDVARAGAAPARGWASASRATRTAPPMPPWSRPSPSRRPCASIACGASPMPAWWSIPTARATSSRAASSRR